MNYTTLRNCAWLLITVMGLLWPFCVEGHPTDISNSDVLVPPSPGPTLPPAGGKFVDPTFGTEIIRVTDANDGNNANVAYAYWNLFNADSSRFFVLIDSTIYLYDFDKAADAITKVGPLFPGNPKLTFEGLIWSASDPDALYGFGWDDIYKYHVVTHEYDLIKDISTLWPATYLWQMSMDENEDVFAFTIKRSSDYAALGAGWYKSSTNRYGRWDTGIDECQVDKSGRYLYVHKGSNSGGVVWNIDTNEKITLNFNRTDRPLSHYDQGYGKIVGSDAWANEGFTYILKPLPGPKDYSIAFTGYNWGVTSHISWRNNDSEYAYISGSSVDRRTDGPLENEIIQVFLDGSQRYRRLSHHRSVYQGYSDSPRAAVDRLGKYIIFASNWDNSGRRDVFILKIPKEFQAPGSRPPSPPTGLGIKREP